MIGRRDDPAISAQTIEDSSHVLQASRDMSVSNSNNVVNTFNVVNDSAEIERISKIVFQQNYLRLTDDSRAEAIRLAEDFIAIFLDLLSKEAPEKIYAFDSPRMQAATFEAQKAYVETGDREMAKSLAKILLRRAIESPRSAVDVLYQQAAKAIPKLTQEQLNALAVLVIVYYLEESDVSTFDEAIDSLDRILTPFYGKLPKVSFDYEYMSGCGVGSLLIAKSPFDAIRNMYLHLAHFAVRQEEISPWIWRNYRDCLQADPSDNVRFRFSSAAIEELVNKENVKYQHQNRNVFEEHLFKVRYDEETLRIKIARQSKQLMDTLELLEKTSGTQFSLSGVGYTIGLEHSKSSGGNITSSAEDMWNTPS